MIEKDQPKAVSYLPKLMWRWQKGKVFDDGNGEKILKRVIAFSINNKAQLDKSQIHEYIKLRPNIRSSAFCYLSVVGFEHSDITAINKIAADGHACDDAFYMDYSKAILLGRVDGKIPFKEEIDQTVEDMWSGDFYRVYSAIMLSTRFWNASKILEKLEQKNSLWRHDPHLGRLVGGLAPIAKRDGLYQELSVMINKSMNSQALALFNFHYLVRSDAKFAEPILPKFSALDTSFPCGIRYGKWMMLHSILSNVSISPKRLDKIRSTFAHLKSEPYFSVDGL